jgi:hypothetical protein
MSRGECEFQPDCSDPSEAVVHAQWTLFDFVEHEVCGAHVGHMVQALERTRVDGYAALGIWAVWYDE